MSPERPPGAYDDDGFNRTKMHPVAPILTLAFLHDALAATVCNGHAGLCNKLYSNITFIGSHDSAFVGILPTDNQFQSVSNQLSEGVRFLQAQTHNHDGTIELCHTSCVEKDAGPLEDYLTTIVTFLDANPEEVVTLLLTNQDGIAGTEFNAAFVNAGADTYAYSPGSTLTMGEWPTLGNLIDAGTRLVVFMGELMGPLTLPRWTPTHQPLSHIDAINDTCSEPLPS